MKTNEFGNGRKSVISEMISYCEKEINKIKNHGIDEDSHISASMSGQAKAYKKIKQRLSVKFDRTKSHD